MYRKEARELCYYVTRQACNMVRGAKSKRDTRVKGHSLRKPSGI